MFNIYTYEKKIKQEEEDFKRKIKVKRIEEARKRMLPELADNYQKRIKKFIYDMANNPITIKEHNFHFNTTRQDFMNDNNRKFGGSGKFTFRKYKTDKERIEEYLREKELNDKKTVKPSERQLAQKLEEYKGHHSVEQPIMRFKPRTDLERLYYSINEYSFGKVPKEVVDEQLKKLNLNEVKKNEEEDNQDLNFLSKFENIDERTVEELQTQKEFLNKQGYNEKNSETVKQITLIIEQYNKRHIKNEDDPSKFKTKHAWRQHVNKKVAKKFLGEYNKKTHFKAASIYSHHLDEYKNKLRKNHMQNKTPENFLNFNSFDEPGQDDNINENVFYNGTSSNFYNSSANLGGLTQTRTSEFYNTTNDFWKLNDLLKKTYKNTNTLGDFNMPFNNIDFNPLNKKAEEMYDPKSLIYLKKISQNNSVSEINSEKNSGHPKNFGFLSNLKKNNMNLLAMKNDVINNNNNFFNQSINDNEDVRKYDEEKIVIDNETYLKSQVDLISKKVLRKCNFTNTKSDFNNKTLKAGNGKLMITSGLTLNDFSKKFNVPK